MQAFAAWLRARLETQGWTKSDLERASGVHNSIIWRWLADPPRRPTPANLQRYAVPLGATYEDLMRLCGYLPGESSIAVDPGKAEWNALYDQMAADLRGTVVSMVRAAANTADDPTANHTSPRVNGRRRGLLPPLESHKHGLVLAFRLRDWLLPRRPASALAAVSA